MDDVTKLILFFFMGSLAVLVITHSSGFAQAFGSVTSGIAGLGQVLTGAGIPGGTKTTARLV